MGGPVQVLRTDAAGQLKCNLAGYLRPQFFLYDMDRNSNSRAASKHLRNRCPQERGNHYGVYFRTKE